MKRALIVSLIAVYLLSLGALVGATNAQGAPLPTIYGGTVTVDGQPAPKDLEIYAKIDGQTPARTGRAYVAADGTYSGLAVGARTDAAANKTVTFWASWNSTDELPEVRAFETDRFVIGSGAPTSKTLNLTFQSLPSLVKPSPTLAPGEPTPTPTPTSIAPIPGDGAVPTMAFIVLVVGIGVLLAGMMTMGFLRRRSA